MIWDYIEVFSKIRGKQKIFADDAIDKLNRSTTIILAVIVAIFIGVKNFGINIRCIDEPIHHVKIDMVYVNSLCFAKETYRLSNFSGKNAQQYNVISIYPWLPFIAIFMGISFYLPYIAWKYFLRRNSYHHLPVDISAVNELLKSSPILKKNDFNNNIKLASEYLDRCFSLNNFHDGYLDEYDDLINGKLTTNKEPKKYRDRRNRRIQIHIPLMLYYFLIKILYLTISIVIFLMTAWLLQFDSGSSFLSFSSYLIQKLVYGPTSTSEYIESKYFPRIVFCDLHARVDFRGTVNINQYQCSLPANIFNERAFAFLWGWFIILIVFNLYGLFAWIYTFMFRRRIILNMLSWPFSYNYELETYANSFIYEYLNTEGFLVLMLIKSNTKDWYCRAILRLLWKFHIQRFTYESNLSFLPYNDGDNRADDESQEKRLKSPSTEKTLHRREINLNLIDNHNIIPNTPIGVKKINERDLELKNNPKQNLFKMHTINAV